MVDRRYRLSFAKIIVAALILCFVGFTFNTAYSQLRTGSIKGKVTDSVTGEGLYNANVVLKDTRLGASTDIEGNFTISSVPPGTYTIEVSYISYKTETRENVSVLANTEATADFALAVDVLSLDEVVVTGAGTSVIKKKLGVTIASVKSKEIVESDESNIVAALAAKSPSVRIIKTSGDAGTSASIRVRGLGSIDRGTQPLFVVDGVPINNQTLFTEGGSNGGTEASNRASDINMEDVEGIEILKGAAAAAMYGSRASNGVILITTKSGKPGKTRIEYKSSFGVTEATGNYPLQTWYGQGLDGEFIRNQARSWGAPLNVPGSPHYDSSKPITPVYDHDLEASDGGYSNENNLTVSGGNELTTFFLSLGRTFEKSHWENGSDYERYTGRLKGTQVLTENFKIVGNIAYSHTDANYIQRGDNADGIGIGSLRSPPEWNNRPYLDPETGFHRSYRYSQAEVLRRTRRFDNPFWSLYEQTSNSLVDRIMGSARLEYDFKDWAKINYTLGADNASDDRLNVLPPGGAAQSGNGTLIRNNFLTQEVDANLVVTIEGEKFLENYDWLSGTFMFGHNLNRRTFSQYQVVGDNIGVPGFNQLDNTVDQDPNESANQINTEAFFGQATVDLYDQLYITGALRNEGSSTFGASEKRHWYPKLSGAWEFTKASFIPEIKYLDFGKIRAAYGEAGQQPGVYTTISAFSSGNKGSGGFTSASLNSTYNGQQGYFSSATEGTVNIKPERSREIEFGTNLAFMDSRIGVDLTYYTVKSEDVIFDLNVVPSSGFFSKTANAATIENKGWEASFDLIPIQKPDLTWNLRLLWATNENDVIDLSGAEREAVSRWGHAAAGRPFGEYRLQTWVRHGYGMILPDGTDIDATYDANFNDVYIAADGYPVVHDDLVWSGFHPNPDWTGSIRNEFRVFGNWSVSGLLDIVQGNKMMNHGKAALYSYGTHADTRLRGTVAPIDDGFFAHGEGSFGPGAGQAVEWTEDFYKNKLGFGGDHWLFVEDGSYVKLRDISISYNLRSQFIKDLGLSNVIFRLSGRNLKTWTDYTGWDPETSRYQSSGIGGDDYFNQPQTRTFSFTIRVNY